MNAAPSRTCPRLGVAVTGTVLVYLAVGSVSAFGATLIIDGSQRADPANNRFETITAALPHLNSGDTMLIARGVYRESIDLRRSNVARRTRDAAITRIAAVDGSRPVIKGSDIVIGWRRVSADVYAKDSWPTNSQQVFVDDVPLRQIGGLIFGDFPVNSRHPFASLHRGQGGIWPGRNGGDADDLVAESFYYDVEAKVLYIKTAAAVGRGAIVEVSTRPYLFFAADVEGLELSGLTFAHANTTAVSQSGAVTLLGDRLLIDDIAIDRVDGTGLDVTGNDSTIARSSANRCGTVGMKIRGRRVRVVDNETSYNNTRSFNKWWEAGGAKFVGAGGLRDSEVTGHRAYGNRGDGIWFDWRNDNNRIHRNISAYNSGMGLHYEASSGATIFDNYVFANGQRGIYLPNASDSRIVHNLIAANGMEGIAIVDERRGAIGAEELQPRGNRVAANVLAWNGKTALVLPAQEMANRSDGNAFVDDVAPRFSRGWPSRDQPEIVGLAAWRAASDNDTRSDWVRAPAPELRRRLQDRQPPASGAHPDWLKLLAACASVTTPEMSGVDAAVLRPGTPVGPAP